MTMKMLAAGVVAFLLAGQLTMAADPAGAAGNAAATNNAARVDRTTPSTISTFHCLSLYWSPQGGSAERQVLVQFREAGQTQWRDGLPMRYNPVDSPECKADYRGSLVNLKPGTTYDILLTLEGTDTRAQLQATTWREEFPVAKTIKVDSRDQTLAIDESGTPDGYIVYDGAGAVIDCANKSDVGITVNARYVILRGFTIRNVTQHGIHILAGQHIVIEECDISKWGGEEENGFGFDYQACVFSNNKDLRAVVVQRNKFHHPTWDTNSWAEDHYSSRSSRHPSGPQTIVFWESEGNHVIRYNECWSDPDHYYNDVMGAGFNGSYRGFPGADSDIYCNYIANSWDEGIEAEGGNQNVRIWNNYIENTLMAIGNAPTSIGPLYVWRNVTGRSYSPPGSSWDLSHGNFLKMGFANNEGWMTGHMYIFNNTLLQPNNEGYEGHGGSSRMIRLCVSRNNILHVRPTDTHSISTDRRNADNDFDYDLVSGRFPEGHQRNGVKGTPKYVPDAGFSFDTKTGNFQLAPDSPGFDQGVEIPNFCDVYTGEGPDIGAHEAGTPPMVFGVKANFVPPAAPTQRR